MVIKRFLRRFKKRNSCAHEKAEVIPRRQHCISADAISKNALKVMQRLEKAGFDAYLVGGGVRDILLSLNPKDFDISTDAHPEQIKRLFKNCRLIGRRFRLAHVYFYGEIIEVSTFRGSSNDTDEKTTKTLAHDNTYGTLEEDVWRRDFTVNALYYNHKDGEVLDFAGGVQDLQDRVLKIIGDPKQRLHEDPVRILRAIRFAAKLNFTIDPDLATCFPSCKNLIELVPGARLFDESLKLFFHGHSERSVESLEQHDLFSLLFPMTAVFLSDKESSERHLIVLALQATDQRISAGQSINPGFLFAILLWPVVESRVQQHLGKRTQFVCLRQVAAEVMAEQFKSLRIPKRFQAMMRDMWLLQLHLQEQRPASAQTILRHRYFRASFDMLALRVESGAKQHSALAEWEKLRDATPATRRKNISRWRQRKHRVLNKADKNSAAETSNVDNAKNKDNLSNDATDGLAPGDSND